MSIPMTPAQAAQNSNRDGGGRYAQKTHDEAQVHLHPQAGQMNVALSLKHEFIRAVGPDDAAARQWHTAKDLQEKFSSALEEDRAGGTQQELTRATGEVEERASELTGSGELERARLHLRAATEVRRKMALDRADGSSMTTSPARYGRLRGLAEAARQWPDGVDSPDAAQVYRQAADQIADRTDADELNGDHRHIQDYVAHLRQRAQHQEQAPDGWKWEEVQACGGVADMLEAHTQKNQENAP